MKFSKTEEQKKEIRSFLNDYQSINNDTTITEKAKIVLSLLLYTGNGQDKFTIGYNYIETITGISKNGISAIIGRLEKKGFINRTKGERGKNSEYTINYEAMKSYVSLSVPKCTKKVSKCTSNQVSTCTPTCTPKDADIQLLTNKIDELIQVSKCTSELLEKIYNLYLNININNNINLKDNILNNDNTEEYNIKYQNKKKIITKDNLEILKENSTVEIPNDEDIQSENKILNEIENTSRDNISDNEIPSDLPPLNIDDFFESSNDNLIEYRSNDNNISDELEFSIFGNDIISEDENLNNDTTVKFIDGKFQVVSETEDEINSSSDVEDKNKINLNLNNMDNTISKVEISNNENLSNNDNFEIWGKLQPIYGKTSNVITEYLFTEYENLNDSKNVSDGYHQVKQYISLGKDQIKVSVNQTVSFGILSFKDNVYSFIACNSNIISDSSDTISERCIITPNHAAAEKASNNADTAVQISQLDNYTADTEKVAPVQPQTANNESVDMCYTMYGVTADEMNDILSHHGNYNTKPSKGAWRQMTIRLHGEQTTVSEALNHFKDKKKDGKEYMECNTFLYYFTPICNEVEKLLKTKTMTDEQYQDFLSIIGKLTRGKFAYWRKVFSNREPRPNFPSEKEMWMLLGCPSVTEKTSNDADTAVKMSQVDNYTIDDKKVAPVQSQTANTASDNTVVFPDLNELYKMEYNEAIKTLEKFVVDNPNISSEQKLYFNQNISSAFAVQLYDVD